MFAVIRRCEPGECEADCNCAVVLVDVDVDELSPAELARFGAEGTAEERAVIEDWLAMPAQECAA